MAVRAQREGVMENTMKRLLRAWCIGSSVCLLPLAGHAEDVQRYLVKVDPGLTQLAVTTCFDKSAPRQLSAANGQAVRFLKQARLITATNSKTLELSGTRMRLEQTPPGSCIEYQVSLAGMDARIPWRRGQPPGDERLVDPGLWLWVADSPARQPIEVSFELPEGMTVSAPWTRLAHSGRNALYRLPDRPLQWDARVALGRMENFDIAIAGATLRVALIQGEPRVDVQQVRRWLSAGARAVTTLYGRFPVASPQILVVASGTAREPVPWGQVMRGGGDAVHLYIDQTRPLKEFLDDWTLVHELSHLLHPRMQPGDAWLYEGIASYYQNVLRARSGLLPATSAWNKLHAGFQRGIDGTPRGQTLADVSRDMRSNHRYMRVYWSGAAIALMADQKLRQRSGGRESLDTALDKFQACCLPADRRWDSWDFLSKLDELTGTEVFRALYRQHVHSTVFPNLEGTYRLLGLEARDSRHVRLREDAPLRTVRDAIMTADDHV
jgi:hypothetical protein